MSTSKKAANRVGSTGGSAIDARLLFMIDEAIKSMKAGQGCRTGLYIQALHDFAHGKKTAALDVCMDSYEISISPNVPSEPRDG